MSAASSPATNCVSDRPRGLNRLRRTHARASRRLPLCATVGAEIAFHRMMLFRIVAHRAVRARNHALTAASAARFDNAHHAGDRIFRNRFRVDRTRTKTRRPLAVLAGQRQEGETGLFLAARPYDFVAILAGAEPVFLLARRLAALAAGAALEIDHQRETPALCSLLCAHRFTIPPDATT